MTRASCGLPAAILLGVVVRVPFWVEALRTPVDGDTAIVGLMARDILHGRPWPVFYYGQHYMGSLEAILTAGVFRLTGHADSYALKAAPLVFSLWFVVAVYALTRHAAGVHRGRDPLSFG